MKPSTTPCSTPGCHNKSRPSRPTCLTCLNRESQRKRRLRLRATSTCIDCGVNKAIASPRCEKCLVKRRLS